MDPKDLQLPEIEWSDGRCLKIASQDRFPAAVKDLKVQKNIISRYLNFYLGGKIQKGLSARDLTLAVIAIMPISLSSEEFIWPKSEYSEDGNLLFLTPDDKLKYDINKLLEKRSVENLNEANQADMGEETYMNQADDDITSDSSDTPYAPEKDQKYSSEKDSRNETNEDDSVSDDQENDTSSSEPVGSKPVPGITDLQWYRLKRDIPTNITTPAVEKYGPVENANFCIACNSLLDAWDSNVAARISLKYFFALTALFVMRAKAKTFQNITKYFSQKIVLSVLPGGLKHYTTPHRGFLKKSWKAFRETDRRNQIMYAKLVITSLLHPTRLDKYGKINIIKYAVLSHTAYFGMGIINMLQQLATFTKYEFKILFESLYSVETAVSWHRVNDFFKKYLNKEAKQYTVHWAGIIESESVKHLSCRNNYELAVVIAVFVEKITKNSGVWQSAWVGDGSDLDKCKQLGNKMYDDYERLKLSSYFETFSKIYQRI